MAATSKDTEARRIGRLYHWERGAATGAGSSGRLQAPGPGLQPGGERRWTLSLKLRWLVVGSARMRGVVLLLADLRRGWRGGGLRLEGDVLHAIGEEWDLQG